MTWVMPVPVLLVAYDGSARRAALVAFSAAVLGGLSWVELYHGLLPALAIAQAVVGLAAVFMLVVLASRVVWRRQSTVVGLFAYPVFATSAGYLVARLSSNGTGGSLAYSQVGFLPILQIASVVGLWGITFMLALVASGLATAWLRRHQTREFVTALVVPAVLLAIVAAFGTIRLGMPAGVPGIRVGMAATDTTVADFDTTRPSVALSVARSYATRIEQLGSDGAVIVVLPEKFVGVTPADRSAVVKVLTRAAARAGVWVVAGLNEIGMAPKRNVALVLTPDGQVAVSYLKHHLLVPFESGYVRGRTIAVWGFDERRGGVAICKDMDFPALGRKYGMAGAGILLVPAWDFGRDGWMHSRMAVVRGVESGFSVVRSAQDGLLTVSDPEGRVVAEESSGEGPFVVLAAGVQATHVSTIYDRIGDWFAWACLVVAAGMLLGAATASRRSAPPQPATEGAPPPAVEGDPERTPDA